MKYRVLGVPNALTFVEGTWCRESCDMLPREHFIPRTGASVPSQLQNGNRGGYFVSVDLSKATDGLYHNAVEVVIDSLCDVGAIRSSDLTSIKLGLGLSIPTTWFSDQVGRWAVRRGSPMGTPLSFVVLSWLNAWACQAFTAAAIHGDDAAAIASSSHEADQYQTAVESIGAGVNTAKTFLSRTAFTMCEMMVHVTKGKTVPFYPPPCPAPGLRAPVAADHRCDPLMLKRAERVVRTLFPSVSRDPRLRLPSECGGLGYTGRGLAVSRSIRCRLAAACSRRNDTGVAESLAAKRPFREEGLYPKSLVQVPSQPSLFYKAQRAVERDPLYAVSPPGEGTLVPLPRIVAVKSAAAEQLYRTLGGGVKRKRDSGRPTRTKRSALFKVPQVPNIRPLSKRHGVKSLKALASSLNALKVRVDPDIANEILGRTPLPQAS
jgi:hypothetical protein